MQGKVNLSKKLATDHCSTRTVARLATSAPQAAEMMVRPGAHFTDLGPAPGPPLGADLAKPTHPLDLLRLQGGEHLVARVWMIERWAATWPKAIDHIGLV
jgi:hypothetical protein